MSLSSVRPQLTVDMTVPTASMTPVPPADDARIEAITRRMLDRDPRIRSLISTFAPATAPTTFPENPVDGQIAYITADDTNGIIWTFRRNETDGYWEFAGGPPLWAEVTTEQSTASTSYTDLATTGPTVALPFAGDYMVGPGFRGHNSTASQAAVMSYAIGGTAASDSDEVNIFNAAATGSTPHADRVRRKTGLGAVTLTAKYKASGGTAFFKYRTLTVVPVRVTG